MQADRFHAGGLTDHRVAAQFAVGLEQGLGAAHAALLVGRGEQDQRVFQSAEVDLPERLEYHGEEPLHVAGPQPVPASVALGQAERIAAPARLVVGYRIGVTGQHQAVRAAAEACHQVELAGVAGNRQALDPEACGLAPFSEVVDHLGVGVIPFGADAADRRRADQVPHHFRQAGVFHRLRLNHARAAVQSG